MIPSTRDEKPHKNVRPDDIGRILADEANDRVAMKRSDLFDAPPDATGDNGKGAQVDGGIGSTSDIDEMREAD